MEARYLFAYVVVLATVCTVCTGYTKSKDDFLNMTDQRGCNRCCRGFPGAAGQPGIHGRDGVPGRPGVVGKVGKPGKRGDRGYSGKPGPAGPEGPRGPSGRPGGKGERGPAGSLVQPQKVGFSAARMSDLGDANRPVILTYEHIFVNQGGFFNNNTGQFLCGVSGTYFFTFHVYKRSGQYETFVRLVHNFLPVVAVHEGDNDDRYDGVSNSVLLRLQRGDRVWLEMPAGFFLYSNALDKLTSFSGFLLFSD
ncbi:C1QTNF5 [Branchiostoma lanceolatum]|uniref:C1QTNF5 protein n=1 Tax=Branchiostoma lanceolatum TaxID=7740 RepID=A0A8J9VTF1_BRALA|nr:C1QTNF5 [Branchiostoma lanceolatum]